MKLPLRAFWSLNKQIDRLRAEQDLREVHRLIVAFKGDDKALDHYNRSMRAQIGSVMLEKPRLDRQGLHALKGFAKGN